MSTEDADTSNSSTFHFLEKQIMSLRSEIEQDKCAYHQRKTRLDKEMKTYDAEYESKSDLLQNQLQSLMEDAMLREKQQKQELVSLRETLQTQVDEMLVLAETARKQEKEEHAAAVRDLEQSLKQSLKDQAECQEKQHKQELASLRETWQSKLDELLPTQTARGQEKEESSAAVRDLEQRLKTRDEQVERLLDAVNKQSAELAEAKLERKQLQSEMKNVLVTLHVQYEHFAKQTSKQEEDLAELREEHNTNTDTINHHFEELSTYLDSVQYEMGDAQEHTTASLLMITEEQRVAREAMKEELGNQLEGHGKDVQTLAQKVERVSTGQEKVRGSQVSFLQRFSEIGSAMDHLKQALLDTTSTQASKVVEECQRDIVSLRGEVKSTEERLNTQLDDLSSEVFQDAETQATTNFELRESIGNTESKIAQSMGRIEDITGKVNFQGAKQIALETGMERTLEDFQTKTSEIDIKLQTWSAQLDRLANREFKVRQGELFEKIAVFAAQVDKLEQQVEATPKDVQLTEADVEAMLRPWIKMQEECNDKLQQLAKDLELVNDEERSTHTNRNTVDDKVETMNKTWEALFQHLVSQVKEGTNELHATKTENVIVLKEVKKTIAAWEQKFAEFVSEQASAQSEMKSVLQSNVLEKNSLQAKIDSWNSVINAALTKMNKVQNETKLIQEEVNACKEHINKTDLWQRTHEENVRQTDEVELRSPTSEAEGARNGWVREHAALVDVKMFEKYSSKNRGSRGKVTAVVAASPPSESRDDHE